MSQPFASSSPPSLWIPKTLGIIHIVYAGFLGLFSLLWGAYTVGIPILLDYAQQKVDEQFRAKAERRDQRIAELSAELEQAADPAKQDEWLEARIRAEVESRIDPRPEFSTFGLSSPSVAGPLGGEVFAGLFLYLLMFLAGIGLVRRKSWGRTLALGAAGLKIIQVAIVSGLFAFVSAPAMERDVSAQVSRMIEAQSETIEGLAAEEPEPQPEARPLPSPEEMGRQVRSLILVHALGTLVFGSLYPLVTLFVLTRPSVEAAFRSTTAPPVEVNPA
jgi:hypothetical protein